MFFQMPTFDICIVAFYLYSHFIFRHPYKFCLLKIFLYLPANDGKFSRIQRIKQDRIKALWNMDLIRLPNSFCCGWMAVLTAQSASHSATEKWLARAIATHNSLFFGCTFLQALQVKADFLMFHVKLQKEFYLPCFSSCYYQISTETSLLLAQKRF